MLSDVDTTSEVIAGSDTLRLVASRQHLIALLIQVIYLQCRKYMYCTRTLPFLKFEFIYSYWKRSVAVGVECSSWRKVKSSGTRAAGLQLLHSTSAIGRALVHRLVVLLHLRLVAWPASCGQRRRRSRRRRRRRRLDGVCVGRGGGGCGVRAGGGELEELWLRLPQPHCLWSAPHPRKVDCESTVRGCESTVRGMWAWSSRYWNLTLENELRKSECAQNASEKARDASIYRFCDAARTMHTPLLRDSCKLCMWDKT